jgi:hypothetical protein
VLTRRHIKKYLDRVSRDAPDKDGQMSDHAWQQLHEYLVKHYGRLDKRARSYADEIFDQLDASVRQRIESLPGGREKKLLRKKLSIVRAERSPIPVLYLDIPVMESFIRQALGQPSSGPTGGDPEALWRKILALVKDGKIICPEDTFRREALEIGGAEALEGLNIMRGLSKGFSFRHSQTIEDFQVFRALRGFIGGNGSVTFRRFWQDAFDGRTVVSIMKKRSSVTFEGALALAEKPNGTGGQEAEPAPLFTRLRIRCDETALKNEQELQQRSSRHLRDLVRLGMRYETMRGEAQKRHMDGFWAGQKTDLSVFLWNHYGGRPEGLEGLISFYESDHFTDVPAIKIKREIWNAISADYPEGLRRAAGPLDVNILSAVLPYTDMMILGREMTDVVRGVLGLDARFDTEIYGMDEEDQIMAALREVIL